MPESRQRRVDAELNRQRLLDAARAAFAVTGAQTSMAEVARKSGLGSATLYRNFATRQSLLEALLTEEIDEVCRAAATVTGDTPGDRLLAWLRIFYRYVTEKRPVVLGLLVLEDTDASNPVFDTRGRLIRAAGPLLDAARSAGEVADGVGVDQVLDLVMAIAKIAGDEGYREPILAAALDGLRRRPAEAARPSRDAA